MIFKKKSHVEQHLNTALHKENRNKTVLRQSLLTQNNFNEQTREKNEFYYDLCQALVASNIPFVKLENSGFKGFLEKYCKKNVPNESTLRKNYLPKCYEKVSRFKSLVREKFCYKIKWHIYFIFIHHFFVNTCLPKCNIKTNF